MSAFSSVRGYLFPCVLVAGSLICGAASLAAQTTLVSHPAAALSPSLFERAVAPEASDSQATADLVNDRAERRRRRILWGAILGGTVVATVLGDVANQGLDFPETFVPVAGPFIALARYNNVVTNPYYDGKTADKILFAASGVVQAFSAVMIIKTLGGGGGRQARGPGNVPAISLVPTGRRGFRLTCQLRF
jgi:hypothetical protein